MTQSNSSVYHELVDLIARAAPEKLLTFRLSPEAAERVETLTDQEKSTQITLAEQEELDTYMHLSRILMLAQAQAHQILHGTPTSQTA